MDLSAPSGEADTGLETISLHSSAANSFFSEGDFSSSSQSTHDREPVMVQLAYPYSGMDGSSPKCEGAPPSAVGRSKGDPCGEIRTMPSRSIHTSEVNPCASVENRDRTANVLRSLPQNTPISERKQSSSSPNRVGKECESPPSTEMGTMSSHMEGTPHRRCGRSQRTGYRRRVSRARGDCQVHSSSCISPFGHDGTVPYVQSSPLTDVTTSASQSPFASFLTSTNPTAHSCQASPLPTSPASRLDFSPEAANGATNSLFFSHSVAGCYSAQRTNGHKRLISPSPVEPAPSAEDGSGAMLKSTESHRVPTTVVREAHAPIISPCSSVPTVPQRSSEATDPHSVLERLPQGVPFTENTLAPTAEHLQRPNSPFTGMVIGKTEAAASLEGLNESNPPAQDRIHFIPTTTEAVYGMEPRPTCDTYFISPKAINLYGAFPVPSSDASNRNEQRHRRAPIVAPTTYQLLNAVPTDTTAEPWTESRMNDVENQSVRLPSPTQSEVATEIIDVSVSSAPELTAWYCEEEQNSSLFIQHVREAPVVTHSTTSVMPDSFRTECHKSYTGHMRARCLAPHTLSTRVSALSSASSQPFSLRTQLSSTDRRGLVDVADESILEYRHHVTPTTDQPKYQLSNTYSKAHMSKCVPDTGHSLSFLAQERNDQPRDRPRRERHNVCSKPSDRRHGGPLHDLLQRLTNSDALITGSPCREHERDFLTPVVVLDESEMLREDWAREICVAVRPFAREVLLQLMIIGEEAERQRAKSMPWRSARGGCRVSLADCTEVLNRVLESHGVMSVRATRDLCARIAKWGNREKKHVEVAQGVEYAQFVANLLDEGCCSLDDAEPSSRRSHEFR